MRYIAFVLGMSQLGLPINFSNYREICNVVYLAESRGIHISPRRIEFDSVRGYAYSPLTHETGGNPSENLATVIEDIIINPEYNDVTKRWRLDDLSRKRLDSFREEIETQGIGALLGIKNDKT